MNRTWLLGGLVAAMAMATAGGPSARADDKDVTAVLDKAIKALGGEEKLGKAAGFTWKFKGVLTLNGNDNELSGKTTIVAPDRYRTDIEGEFNGDKVKIANVVNGDKAWMKFGDNAMPLDGDALANEKRSLSLQLSTLTVLPLKGKGYKVAADGEEKVGDKPAVVLKVTGPEGKDFKLFLDKATGLPVKMTAKVAGFGGEEYDQETLYTSYKDFDGIQKATKVEIKRNGEKFLTQDITDFKVVDKIEPGTFDEPQ